MKAKVLKKIISDGKSLNLGDTVDVSNWRNAKTLIAGRYIEILDEEIKEVKPNKETLPVVAEVATAKPKTTDKITTKKSE